jgi:hypothetical protein
MRSVMRRSFGRFVEVFGGEDALVYGTERTAAGVLIWRIFFRLSRRFATILLPFRGLVVLLLSRLQRFVDLGRSLGLRIENVGSARG